MASYLDSVLLPDLVIDNEFGISRVEAKVESALDGTPIVWTQDKPTGDILLLGGADFGWISRSTLQSLQALAAVAGATYTLDYEGEQRLVRFQHENPPVIEAEPVIPRPNQQSTDWYMNVKIHLAEV